MIGIALGTTMIVAGVVLASWGTWRCSRPVLFWRRLQCAWGREIEANYWADRFGNLDIEK